MTSQQNARLRDSSCSIARSLGVLGERWTLLILRDALLGVTRFADFQRSLGLAPDVLTDRLSTLVEFGVLTREPYQDTGSRVRHEYRLTDAGRELQLVLTALQQWGDEHVPRAEGPSLLRRRNGTEQPVHVGLIDEAGDEVALDELTLIRTPSHPDWAG